MLRINSMKVYLDCKISVMDANKNNFITVIRIEVISFQSITSNIELCLT